MASKRKSTTPCMIPPKTNRSPLDRDSTTPDPPPPPTKNGASREGREEEEEPIPSALTTIVRVLGSKDCSQSSWSEEGAVPQQGRDSYTCQPCRFESRDLNLFLDHVYSGHPEFRADPTFHCTDCGVSSPKFEGLALHNARAHPSLGAAGSTTSAALQVRRRDRRVRVEQSLVTGEGTREAEITITKTPIMKMLRGKSEHKRIVVSHVGTAEEPGPEVGRKDPQMAMPPPTIVPPTASIIHNGTAPKALPQLSSAIQIVNGSGALPLLKTAISQVVTVVQNRTPHQSAPITVSSSSSSCTSSSPSSRNLPKVMIPLSSIPTYNAAMDSSSFLKTSFSKFPYPTKAELCYLTVVTKYPEEQIKIWFTAQRLKQGISWSPEEIEDSRRKMFNTIIQAPSAGHSQSAQARHAHQGPAHHTFTVLPTPLGSGGVPHILQGSLVGQGGMIVTQPVITNGLQVSSAPVTLAVTPRPQPRPQTQARPAAAVGADKGGAVGSRNRVPGTAVTSGNGITSSNNLTSIITSSICSNNTSNGSTSNSGTGSGSIGNNGNTSKANGNNAANKANGDGCGKMGDSAAVVAVSPVLKGAPSSRTLPSSFLDPSFYKSKKSAEQLGTLKQSFVRCEFPGQDEVERLTRLTGLTVREVRKWFSDRRYHNRNLKGPRSSTGGGPFAGGALLDLTDSPSSSGSPQSPLATATVVTASVARRAPPSQMADFTAVRYKERDPQQIRALEASYAQDPLPSTEEVDRLRAETKMTRREIDGWFSERRKRATPKRKIGEGEQEEDEEDEEDDDGGEGKSDPDDPLQGTSMQQCGKEDELKVNPKVNPIKINLKMLKVTKPEPESGIQSERESDSPKSPPPAPPLFTSGRGKKSAEQLHLLRQVFACTHWPSSLQYDQLIARTGLPRPEVVRWFGDSRYVYKNGQLKWLESYQHAAAAEEKEEEKKDDDEEEEEEEEDEEAEEEKKDDEEDKEAEEGDDEEDGEGEGDGDGDGDGDTTVLKDQGKLDKEEAPVVGGQAESCEPSAEGQGQRQRLPQAPESRKAEEKEKVEEVQEDQGAVKKEAEQNRSSPACGEGGTAPVTTVQFSKPSPGGSSQDGSPGL